MGTRPIRVSLLEEVSIFRETLRGALESCGFEVVADTGDPAAFLGALDTGHPNVALVGLFLRSSAGLSVLRRCRAQHPEVAFLVLAAGPPPLVRERAMAAGAAGLLDTLDLDAEHLAGAIQQVAKGEPCFPALRSTIQAQGARNKLAKLSNREREVLSYVAAGADNLKIAAHLGISERTAKAHVQALYRKLDVENRTQLALLALQLGIRGADI